MTTATLTSPYRNGANTGTWLGIMLSAMFLCSVLAQNTPVLALPAIILFVTVPLLVYRSLRLTYTTLGGKPSLSFLWMQGIVSFACGSLILALTSTAYMRWIEPQFINQTVQKAIKLYSAIPDPQSQNVAQMLTQMVKAHAVPSAVYISLELVWLGIFSGSILSLLLTILVRARPIKKNTTPNP